MTAILCDRDLPAIQHHLRHAANPTQVQQWLQVRPYRAYRDLAGNWLAIALAIALVATYPVWWTIVLAFLIVGTRQYALFILAHDAIHYSLHPHRQVNDNLARWGAYGPMFMALEDARRNHLLHHRYAGTADDPDRYIHTLSGKNDPIAFLLFCSGLATFGKTVLKVTPFGKLRSPSPSRDRGSVSKALQDYLNTRRPVFVCQALIFSVFLFLPTPWWLYLVLWIAPIYFLVFVPDEIRAFCDHAVIADDRAGDRQRLVTFCPSFLEAMVFSPHQMNYHAEHHLWPAIPHYNLPKAHRWVKLQPEVTLRYSYLRFLWQVTRSLPLKMEDSK